MILLTGSVVEDATAAPVVEIWPRFRQASRESAISGARFAKLNEPREECDNSARVGQGPAAGSRGPVAGNRGPGAGRRVPGVGGRAKW